MHAPWARSPLLLSLASFFSLLRFASVQAQTNITVPSSDASITYSGQGTGDAQFCQYTPDGTIIPGQAGCYNVPSMCAPSAAMGQSPESAAEFRFRGSAIYVTALLFSISPIYTITLDGRSTDVDGVRDSRAFTCAPLFSFPSLGEGDLDPSVEHTIRVAVKGPSPNRNTTIDPDGSSTVFGLVNFIYTVPEASTTDTAATATTSTSAAQGTSGGGPKLKVAVLSALLGILAVVGS